MQIMELLGPSLWDVWKKTEQSLSPEYAACVAVEALTILEDLHRRGSATTPCMHTSILSHDCFPSLCHSGKPSSKGLWAWQDARPVALQVCAWGHQA